MKIIFTVVDGDELTEYASTEMEQVPHEGDLVMTPSDDMYRVGKLTWMPMGRPGDDAGEPGVMVALVGTDSDFGQVTATLRTVDE